MNRRLFLGAIASAFVADPERLLWRPGAKLISIPKPRKLLIDKELVEEGMRILQRDLRFHPVAYVITIPKIGDTMIVRKSPRFLYSA